MENEGTAAPAPSVVPTSTATPAPVNPPQTTAPPVTVPSPAVPIVLSPADQLAARLAIMDDRITYLEKQPAPSVSPAVVEVLAAILTHMATSIQSPVSPDDAKALLAKLDGE